MVESALAIDGDGGTKLKPFRLPNKIFKSLMLNLNHSAIRSQIQLLSHYLLGNELKVVM